ncbi:MAG: hypothetical protein UT09_C0051G0005 [Parcubacteria group bacterium GW2011_GWF2_38_8]|nr:MAG: hypothetical protein UT09_C0051G0005 [Parcubacteria group bacterium GW2011_GWF2_38_8]
MKKIILSLIVVLGVGVVLFFMFFYATDVTTETVVEEIENSSIDFSTNITNPYFSLPVGRSFTYEGKTEEGVERVEITITGETRVVNGVETLVYRDKVWLDGELVEDTRDYLAQDKEGNVWYFGEDVDNYEDGKIVDHDGSWHAGVDGAEAGIWMKANPVVGETYKQEYLKGKAEDMADVVSVTEKLTIRGIKYENCLKTYDYTPLDPESKEYKYYCKEVGNLVLEENILTKEKIELLSVK